MHNLERPAAAPSAKLDTSPEAVLAQEWLETNGLGGFASSSVAVAHTRKYHGLLISRTPEPHVLLSKLDATLISAGQRLELGTNLFPGAIHPQGFRRLAAFSRSPHPRWRYSLDRGTLETSLLMPRGQDAVLLRYTLSADAEPCELELTPLLAFRGLHRLTHENFALRARVFPEGLRHKISPYPGMPDLFFEHEAGVHLEFFPGPHWYYRFEYPREQQRGFDFREDLFCPGLFEVAMRPGSSFTLRVGTCAGEQTPGETWQAELERREARDAKFAGLPGPVAELSARAEDFLVETPSGLAIQAGYPWFECWGRDAMIAVPGLCFGTGRLAEGTRILRTFAGQARSGLIPNFLNASGDHAYNSVDASLWFGWAVGELRQLAHAEARAFLPALADIVDAVMRRATPGLWLQESGLVWSDAQLTWMDAKVHGVPVTPRRGLAVEINALWIHLLDLVLELSDEPSSRLADVAALRDRAKQNFARTFWLPEERYLADVVELHDAGSTAHSELRPNQLIAVSLGVPGLLSEDQARSIVRAVSEALVTPYGLRTLSPTSPGYRAHYAGSPEERDGAYHQGTVWPWLIGHYVSASLRTAEDSAATAARLSQTFAPLFERHLGEYGLGSIAEVFDAEQPFAPGGCIAQAWSVGELLRANASLQRSLHPHPQPQIQSQRTERGATAEAG
ncbi:MAG: amylo-alpha-1,6-glucosidase [Polyangiaceae bacterium]